MQSPYFLPLWLLRYQVGSPEQPFMHRAIIRLYGHVRDPEIPVYGAKVLAVRQGFLELHGKPRLRTWTRLARTAQQNDTILYLQVGERERERGSVMGGGGGAGE